jgi:hypothetical protein
MKKTTAPKTLAKLHLHRETLLALQAQQLQAVAGANTNPTNCNPFKC